MDWNVCRGEHLAAKTSPPSPKNRMINGGLERLFFREFKSQLIALVQLHRRKWRWRWSSLWEALETENHSQRESWVSALGFAAKIQVHWRSEPTLRPLMAQNTIY